MFWKPAFACSVWSHRLKEDSAAVRCRSWSLPSFCRPVRQTCVSISVSVASSFLLFVIVRALVILCDSSGASLCHGMSSIGMSASFGCRSTSCSVSAAPISKHECNSNPMGPWGEDWGLAAGRRGSEGKGIGARSSMLVSLLHIPW